MLFATAACNFWTSERQPVLRTPHVLYIFTSKFAFRHSGVQFFVIRTSKSAPNTSCFENFHFHMCFSPQRRAIFQHRNFKSAPKLSCFVHFHFQICVSPQRRAFFRQENSKKCFGLTCFVHFHFKMCFSPQRRAIFDFSLDHLTPHPPL